MSTPEGKLDAILSAIGRLATDVAGLKTDVGNMAKRQDEMVVAFRAHWSEMSALYRGSREELKRFEDRMDGKLGQVAMKIQGLTEALEAQDFHARQLAHRVTQLEGGREPPL